MNFFLSVRCWTVLVVLLVTLSSSYAANRLVFEGDSAYTSMQVLDKTDGLRYLQFGIYEQTAMRLSDPDYLHYEYTRTIMAGFAFAHAPVKKVLMLGLGGGAMARFIAGKFPDATLDIIEIDPLVVDVARQYFEFKPGRDGNVFIGDGRQLLRKSKMKYDVIILDAYKAGEIPFHLTTQEFMQSVKDHTAPGGVAIVHLWAEYANKYLQAQIKTIASVFPRNYSFYDNAGSYMIFATQHNDWLTREALIARGEQIAKEKKFDYDLGQLISEQFTTAARIQVEGLQGQILTDDFAPVNLLKHQEGR